MKPTALKPGDRVHRVGSTLVLTFVRREPRQGARPAVNVFRANGCRGMYGPDDDGMCVANDSDVSRYYELITTAPARPAGAVLFVGEGE